MVTTGALCSTKAGDDGLHVATHRVHPAAASGFDLAPVRLGQRPAEGGRAVDLAERHLVDEAQQTQLFKAIVELVPAPGDVAGGELVQRYAGAPLRLLRQMVEQEPLPRTDAGELRGEAGLELSAARPLAEGLRLDGVDEFVALSV